LKESEVDESPVADLRRMMIRMFNEFKNELKENIQKQLNSINIKRAWIKFEKTQKREDFNKLKNETKEIIKKRNMKQRIQCKV
jgi:hypothetical protein